ncbi:hypothetical protein ACVWZV_000261 [Bradyrhizobium sp. GM5.1]
MDSKSDATSMSARMPLSTKEKPCPLKKKKNSSVDPCPSRLSSKTALRILFVVASLPPGKAGSLQTIIWVSASATPSAFHFAESQSLKSPADLTVPGSDLARLPSSTAA